MSEESSRVDPFAYILIIESDRDLRRSALHTITPPNCAVDVALDEDEAVHKALQHRPQLIILKLHQPIEVDPWNPPSNSMASYICHRAHLSRAVRLVTLSDVALTVVGKQSATEFSNPQQLVLMRPQFKSQDWRKEWYLYCREKTQLLSDHLPFLLGRYPYPPYFLKHSLDTLQRHWDLGTLDPPYLLSRESLLAWKRLTDIFPN